ncbi:hypothetical protein NSK_006133 [Nannochloropsis salina CCMP1776]|uniref:Major facilitator superfamily (MFS) profile domain-containing protein n=1 Tax=Nannochloropsis salina CCMP1776 TaxID=1027361 RepID=A0A4D9D1Q7_9STRA|nr:hypothetical protein NSK_006133 [Nannochloropsis salina CCMP1776]|eukprot:TFJ82549.1 hypothetical protein NSK_006133 [Nannochloropsis salina CCMP1776]
MIQDSSSLWVKRAQRGKESSLTLTRDGEGGRRKKEGREEDIEQKAMFWVLGSVTVVGMAWGVLTEHGWRYLTLLATLPLLITSFACLLLPESSRWLLEEGRTEDAWKVLIKAAQWNGIKDLRSHLFDLRWDHAASLEAEGGREGGREGRREGVREGGAEDEAARQAQPACPLLAHHHHRLSVSEGAPTEKPPSAFAAFFKTLPLLLVPGLRATTLWLWLIWFSFGLAYYGIIILCASLFTLEGGEDDALFDYPALLYAAASEAVGVLLALALLERCGRKNTQASTYLLAALGAFLLALFSGFRLPAHPHLLTAAMICRIGAMAASSATWVATPESYPTAVRSTGHSVASAVARVGAILAPEIIRGGAINNWVPGGILTAVTVVAAMAAMMLPETGGKGLGAMNDSKEVEMEERALEDSMEGRPESQGGRTAAQKEGGQAVVVAIDQAAGGGPAEEK